MRRNELVSGIAIAFAAVAGCPPNLRAMAGEGIKVGDFRCGRRSG